MPLAVYFKLSLMHTNIWSPILTNRLWWEKPPSLANALAAEQTKCRFCGTSHSISFVVSGAASLYVYSVCKHRL